MVVGVDEPGEDRAVRAVDHPVRRPPHLADGRDPALLNEDVPADHLAAGVLRDDVAAAE